MMSSSTNRMFQPPDVDEIPAHLIWIGCTLATIYILLLLDIFVSAVKPKIGQYQRAISTGDVSMISLSDRLAMTSMYLMVMHICFRCIRSLGIPQILAQFTAKPYERTAAAASHVRHAVCSWYDRQKATWLHDVLVSWVFRLQKAPLEDPDDELEPQKKHDLLSRLMAAKNDPAEVFSKWAAGDHGSSYTGPSKGLLLWIPDTGMDMEQFLLKPKRSKGRLRMLTFFPYKDSSHLDVWRLLATEFFKDDPVKAFTNLTIPANDDETTDMDMEKAQWVSPQVLPTFGRYIWRPSSGEKRATMGELCWIAPPVEDSDSSSDFSDDPSPPMSPIQQTTHLETDRIILNTEDFPTPADPSGGAGPSQRSTQKQFVAYKRVKLA